MMHIPLSRWTQALLILLVVATATVAVAQDRPRRQGQQTAQTQPQTTSEQTVLRLLPGNAVTEHAIDTPAGKLDYTATAGTLSLFDQSGERVAGIFYTAYVLKNADAAKRPLTFVFNGGPGAASAFLHLGLVGPRIAELNNRDTSAAQMSDNPHTWLAFTDLVMIDPVGSGWSRPAKPDGGQAFWSVRRDAESLAKTIALYVSGNARSASPKYILGESYGGFRAAKVARALKRDQGISVTGIVMVSPLTEAGLIFNGTRFALGAALQLAPLAASELERNGTFSKEKMAEAERFAMTEYLSTLAGPPPRGEAARVFYTRIAEMTGLPLDVVTTSRGFIRDSYVKNLRAGERKIVSRYDATFTADDPYPDQRTPRGPDPMLDGLTRAYGSAFSTYAREELKFSTDMTYVLLASDIAGKWDWGEGGGRATASIADDIRELLSLEPGFRLMIAHGYSDMVTPYTVSRYMLDHLPPIGDPSRTELSIYRGGHMFYIDAASRRAFTTDVRRFYDVER
ncbi:MAG TPA: carboxypeptidase [Xanthobacteraceae bacterium]|jgi:carboxypeptidase C (cathepsin A)|nr:carboxypeptidase [Xanthobacteraceae bacterium]